MKITRFNTRVLRVPAENPLVDGIPIGPGTRDFVTLELDTDEGIQGIGYSFIPGMVGNPLFTALKVTVDVMCEMIVGDDPIPVEAIVDKLKRQTGTIGPGMFNFALAGVDMALWDIKGKAFGLPVATLLGGHRDRVPTYASGQLTRDRNLEFLADVGQRLVEKGFRQMKTQMGAEPSADDEVARIRVMREAIGPDIDLMCDINQLWDVNRAISIGKRVEEYNLFWLEDMTTYDDYQGLARIADALTTPIAAGEYVFGIAPFRQLIENRSVDIVMIDFMRVGGITQFQKVAGMAEAFNLPVVSHVAPEVQVHNVAAIPNGLTVEYMPWSLQLFEETPAIVEGEIVVPDKPGLGLAFSEAAIRQYAV